MDTSDKLIEAYSRLKALRQNLPETPFVQSLFATEYEEVRHLLQSASGKDLGGFEMPSNAFFTDRSGPFCNGKMLLAKVEGLLSFFEFQMSDPKPKIGFQP
jgi:hypothetical protein